MPDLTLACLGGGPAVRLRAGTTGLPTVLNVWGSWCGPCREELPDFQAVSTRLAGRVAFVGVDTGDVDRAALSLAAFVGLTYPSVVDRDGAVSAAFGNGTPQTAFLDATGRVVHTQLGRIFSEQELEQLISEHLGVRA